MNHKRKLDEITKKEFYRDVVKQRNNQMIEEKKNKTLWRLEKIEPKGSPGKQRGKAGSASSEEEMGGP